MRFDQIVRDIDVSKIKTFGVVETNRERGREQPPTIATNFEYIAAFYLLHNAFVQNCRSIDDAEVSGVSSELQRCHDEGLLVIRWIFER
jgi:hypothetical protein